MAQKWDIIIIGGGLAGYVAANFLTKDGLSVLVLEKAKNVGGRAQTTKKKGQYLNLGPHALYKKGMASPIFKELGIRLPGNSPDLKGILIENDEEFSAPFNPEGLFSTRLLTWKERLEWLRFIVKISRIDTQKLDEKTFSEWIGQTGCSQNVQSLLLLLGKLGTYCNAPEKESAKVMVSHLKTVMGGVIYMDGGWQTMIDQLHNQAVISGAEVRTAANVKQIIPVEDGTLTLMLATGEEIFGKHVISTVPPADLANMVDSRADFPEREFFKKIIPVTGAALDVALARLPEPKRLFAMSLSHPLYYSVHSNYARLSEEGASAVLHVFKYHAPGEIPDSKETEQQLEQFLDKMQPGWREVKVTSRFMPHITVNQRLPQVGDEQHLLRAETNIPGLYIAGDWAHPGAILAEGAVSSGKLAADEIRNKERGGDHAAYERGVQAL